MSYYNQGRRTHRSQPEHPHLPLLPGPILRLPLYALLLVSLSLNVPSHLEPDDDSNTITLPADPPIQAKTTWTLLLYLTSASEGCVGGETVFYPHDRKSSAEEIAVPLQTGMLLLHKHGDDCLLVCDSFVCIFPWSMPPEPLKTEILVC